MKVSIVLDILKKSCLTNLKLKKTGHATDTLNSEK